LSTNVQIVRIDGQSVTIVLLPRLSGWISQLDESARYPALETVLARTHVGPPLAGQLDPLRMKLFSLPATAASSSEVPVAALGLLAAGTITTADRAYYLRLDPVSLQADISSVRLMRSGFGGFAADYRQQVQDIVTQVLAEDGLELQAASASATHRDNAAAGSSLADFWTVTLAQRPAVHFTPLDDALGADISDCMPEGDDGRRWKRLANDIQMALHASPANEQRRQRGEPVINGVWFWGGGNLPEPVEACSYDRVYSFDPVSAGLARLHGIEVESLSGYIGSGHAVSGGAVSLPGQSVLVDWAIPASTDQAAALMLSPEKLETFCAGELMRLRQKGGVLEVHSPEASLRLTPARLRQFWRRPKPLAQQLRHLFKWPPDALPSGPEPR
jgi:hypothetical protein